MFNFDFSEKGPGIVSSPDLANYFLRKYFSCHILLTDQISLSDCVYFFTFLRILQFGPYTGKKGSQKTSTLTSFKQHNYSQYSAIFTVKYWEVLKYT